MVTYNRKHKGKNSSAKLDQAKNELNTVSLKLHALGTRKIEIGNMTTRLVTKANTNFGYCCFCTANSNYPPRPYWAPKVCRAALSSRTAVSASSKFSADIAHLACFCAFAIAISSVLSCWLLS